GRDRCEGEEVCDEGRVVDVEVLEVRRGEKGGVDRAGGGELLRLRPPEEEKVRGSRARRDRRGERGEDGDRGKDESDQYRSPRRTLISPLCPRVGQRRIGPLRDQAPQRERDGCAREHEDRSPAPAGERPDRHRRGEKDHADSSREDRPAEDSEAAERDRKSTRLNSSHQIISYAVF